MTLLIKGDRADEGHLILRATPGGAAVELAAEVRVIDLDATAQHIAGLAFDHRLHQLVVHEPGAGIADPQVPLQCQSRQTGLGLTDEVHRQKPHRQAQLGPLEHGAGNQRSLVTAGVAPEGLAGSDAQHAVGRTTTAGAAKALRPARVLQRRLTLSLGPELLKQLKQRHPPLKLNTIHGHDAPRSQRNPCQGAPLGAQFVSLAAGCF